VTAALRQTIRAAQDRETRERTAGGQGPDNDRRLSAAWPPAVTFRRGPDVFGAIRRYEGR